MDNRSRASILMDAAYRYTLMTLGSKYIPLFIVTEFPKSGGTWAAQMLAELAGLPFPRNRLFNPGRSMLHTHLCYSKKLANTVYIVRDGRDVMVSFYYHNLFESEKNSPILVRNMRNSLQFEDYEDIKSNLPRFIEFMHQRLAGSVSPHRFTWGEFVQSIHNKPAIVASYESLLEEPVPTLRRLLQQLPVQDVQDTAIEQTVEKYSFINLSKRAPGDENTSSFLRKGIAGDWKDKFTRQAAEVFDEFYGEQLIGAGYEQDRHWIETLK